MRQSWLKRIYLYEAFVLVLASSLLGIIIGTEVLLIQYPKDSVSTAHTLLRGL